MDMIEGPLQVEQLQAESQPRVPMATPEVLPVLDDAMVRQAIIDAESKGQNPLSLTVADAQGQTPAPETQNPVVPEKFLKPDGEVDVEKLKTSTERLNEAIQKKDEANKSVDELVREYNELQKQFRNSPNPERRMRESVPQTRPPETRTELSEPELKARILEDLQKDFVGTMADFQRSIAKNELAPLVDALEEFKQEKRDQEIRRNISEIAKSDPRILNSSIYEEVKKELASDAAYFGFKNPHKAAYLSVKERLRLGEPSQAPAQPGRAPSPILGGGTPPPTPSSSLPKDTFSSLTALDLRDRKQEEAGDAQIRAMLEKQRF